ncbi:MAG: glycoside hydrolase family 20 zincin-like fold domain-containing protein [Ignavibacteriaceae bacterium]
MKKIILLLITVSYLFSGTAFSTNVFLQYKKDVPQIKYAARKLTEALTEKNYNVTDANTNYDILISLDVDSIQLGAEAFSIIPEDKVITIYGGDKRGLIYGALALVEHLKNGIALKDVKPERDKPRLEFRGIKFNLPWHTYRPSSALDQHYETVRNLKFWEAFLDMMVENRFNVISLWNLDPYTFMIKPKNFPEASPWPVKEMAEWQHFYHELFRMAKERGLDTYIVHWNIFVSKQFAEAHNVAKQNFYPHYFVKGDTSEIVRRYMRDCVKQVLQDVKLIHRVPFSSGTSSDPGVSKNVEEVTRAAMENLGNSFEGPIWTQIKFNWSHGHSTPELVKVHGGKLGDTYFKPDPKNYKIVWTVRNEDFFVLRWSVPDFIRKHIAENCQEDYVGGYFIGSETYIPALDYFTAVKEPVDWKWAFQRQWLFYKLWGRLLYDPKTPDKVFQAEFNRRYGSKGDNLLKAYELASNTQLRLACLYDSKWDFTLYCEGFLALQGDTTKYISVNQLIDQPTMAPEYVSVKNYVEKTLKGVTFANDRVTPDKLAAMLEKDNREALRLVENIDVSGNASLMYEVADVKVWAYLGLHLVEKLRGAIALETYRLQGRLQDEAIQHLKKALGYWDKVIEITRPIYKDMPLTHYNHNFFTANKNNLFHWALIRDEVARDVDIALAGKK